MYYSKKGFQKPFQNANIRKKVSFSTVIDKKDSKNGGRNPVAINLIPARTLILP